MSTQNIYKSKTSYTENFPIYSSNFNVFINRCEQGKKEQTAISLAHKTGKSTIYIGVMLWSNEFSNPPGTITFSVVSINWDCVVCNMIVTIWL